MYGWLNPLRIICNLWFWAVENECNLIQLKYTFNVGKIVTQWFNNLLLFTNTLAFWNASLKISKWIWGLWMLLNYSKVAAAFHSALTHNDYVFVQCSCLFTKDARFIKSWNKCRFTETNNCIYLCSLFHKSRSPCICGFCVKWQNKTVSKEYTQGVGDSQIHIL